MLYLFIEKMIPCAIFFFAKWQRVLLTSIWPKKKGLNRNLSRNYSISSSDFTFYKLLFIYWSALNVSRQIYKFLEIFFFFLKTNLCKWIRFWQSRKHSLIARAWERDTWIGWLIYPMIWKNEKMMVDFYFKISFLFFSFSAAIFSNFSTWEENSKENSSLKRQK